MVYLNNIPQANEKQNVSQPKLLGNFGQLDTSFSKDHYPFSDLTVNNGIHNTISNLRYSVDFINPSASPPTTDVNHCSFYGFQDTTGIGLLQYSKGPLSSAPLSPETVPTPVTNLQSSSTLIGPLASGASVTMFDAASLQKAFFTVYATSATAPGAFLVTECSLVPTGLNKVDIVSLGSAFSVIVSGTQIKLKNIQVAPISNILWTIRFHRIETT